MVYIDPKKPRYVGAKTRRSRVQQLAAQKAAEARREKYRLLIHGCIISLGIWGFRKTDLESPDPFLSSTLPLLDALFCIYLLLMMFIEIWRRGSR